MLSSVGPIGSHILVSLGGILKQRRSNGSLEQFIEFLHITSHIYGLLSLGPEGEGTNSKTCVQFNILDFGAKHKYSQ